MSNAYRDLPSVDRLLAHTHVRAAADLPHDALVALARDELARAREAVARTGRAPSLDDLAAAVAAGAAAILRPSLVPVINATGVVIHTNLGRAPLSDDAIRAMEHVSRGYSNLEFDLEAGERGSRYTHLESILTRLTGAQAAIAVNNNASALLLGLSAVCRGHQVIVSRGQAVEIGGGFRIPDVMRQSGADLVEVGTTNRTYLGDYEGAITEDTAALLRVHSSNFRVIGFTASVPLEDMVALARRRNLVVLDDLGSGSLLDTGRFGLAPEPTVQESVAAGADLVFFSGDKLLGGPQAGIVVGRADLVARLRRHPLARAVRMDKASIAGLTATLHHYLRGEALDKVPVWRMIAAPLDGIDRRARRWARAVGEPARVVDGRSMIGGGSLPEESLPTRLLALSGPGIDPDALARALRAGQPPVVARIERDTVLLDPRTVLPDQDRALTEAVRQALTAP